MAKANNQVAAFNTNGAVLQHYHGTHSFMVWANTPLYALPAKGNTQAALKTPLPKTKAVGQCATLVTLASATWAPPVGASVWANHISYALIQAWLANGPLPLAHLQNALVAYRTHAGYVQYLVANKKLVHAPVGQVSTTPIPKGIQVPYCG